jgi:4-hydroxybenzoate polyprenyltransferase
MSSPRTFLALSRPSRLPTVWSNCLAGWWLGGGGGADSLPFLLAGVTLIYFGGAFLNDAFDADFDRHHRPARPIPSGALSQRTVWRWGLGWLAAGALLLLWPGKVPGGLGLALVFLIVVYNAIHRLVPFSPVLKGLCRFFVYVLGASVAERGVTGWSIWCGLALAAYMTAIGYFARWEETPHRARYWPASLLAVPVLLALLMNAGPYRQPVLLISAVLVLWGLRALRQTFLSLDRNISRTLSGLVAGIVLVDWLAVCPMASTASQGNYAPRELSFCFLALFLGTLVLQRFAPRP